MTPCTVRSGPIPLLVSIPHAGVWLPDALAERLTARGRSLPDTDWFVDRLYDLPLLRQVNLLIAHTSRYLIDLNRPVNDEPLYPGQPTTGLCPTTSFDGEPLYRPGQEPTAEEIADRVARYWQPYHDCLKTTLQRLVAEHGVAILLDAHSIASRVPRLFAGRLPDWNFGTNHGRSCSPRAQQRVEQFASQLGDSSHAVNGRFVGGYITRHYGRPEQHIEAIQLELSQATYLDEATGEWCDGRAAKLQAQLMRWIECWIEYLKDRSG